jgi:hypothetical protein
VSRTPGRVRQRLRAALAPVVEPILESAVERRVDARLDQRERELADFTFVVVVAPGRSGSTLVQGLLNEVPGTLVRGENNLFLLDLYRAMRRLRDFQELHTTNRHRQVISPFYGLMGYRRRLFVRLARELFVRGALDGTPAGDVRRLGFKEVLWHRVGPDEQDGFFDFLDDTFPGVRYVLNTRDPQVTVGSGFWRGQGAEQALERVHRVLEVQDHLRRTRPDRTFDVRYETVTGEDEQARDRQLRGLVEFVTGRTASEEELAALVAALGTGYGPHPFGESRDDGRGAVPLEQGERSTE